MTIIVLDFLNNLSTHLNLIQLVSYLSCRLIVSISLLYFSSYHLLGTVQPVTNFTQRSRQITVQLPLPHFSLLRDVVPSLFQLDPLLLVDYEKSTFLGLYTKLLKHLTSHVQFVLKLQVILFKTRLFYNGSQCYFVLPSREI